MPLVYPAPVQPHPLRFAPFGFWTLTTRYGNCVFPDGAATNPSPKGEWFVAGEEGFEPPNAGSRTQCLTTWRLPNGVKEIWNGSCLTTLARRSPASLDYARDDSGTKSGGDSPIRSVTKCTVAE